MSSSAAGGAQKVASLTQVSFRRNPYWLLQRKQRDASKLYKRDLARAGGGTHADGRPLRMNQSWPVVTGDLVQVTSTSRKRDAHNKGKWMKNPDGSWVAQDWLNAQGTVLRVMRKTDQVIVSGVNLRTRIKPPTQDSTGSFYQVESPIPYSHVTLVDPATNGPIAGLKYTGRMRVAKETGSKIPRPHYAKFLESRRNPALVKKKTANAITDTPAHLVLERTYRAPKITATLKPLPEEQQPFKDHILTEPEDLELRVARIRF